MIVNDLLLSSLTNYYFKDDNMDKLLSILKNQHKISLRLIDWFITNFSKKYNTIYLLYKSEGGNKCLDGEEVISQFNVYNSYKSQLKAYSKKRFDPFCRRERIDFNCGEGIITTTVGQLNFFKWSINNNIIEYIKEHIHEIEDDMNNSLKNIKDNYVKSEKRKTRQELSKSALRGLNKNKMKVSITFD